MPISNGKGKYEIRVNKDAYEARMAAKREAGIDEHRSQEECKQCGFYDALSQMIKRTACINCGYDDSIEEEKKIRKWNQTKLNF
jgi:ribosomal protein L37E